MDQPKQRKQEKQGSRPDQRLGKPGLSGRRPGRQDRPDQLGQQRRRHGTKSKAALESTRESVYEADGQDRLLPRLSLRAFDHFRIMALVWALVVLFGVLSYGTFLKREGFPSVSIPLNVISGTYLVNDASQVDRQVTKPISDVVLRDERVKSVQSQARAAFYTIMVQYEAGTDPQQAARDIKAKIKQSANLPEQAVVMVEAPRFGFTKRGDDAVISVYRKGVVAAGASQSLQSQPVSADAIANAAGQAQQEVAAATQGSEQDQTQAQQTQTQQLVDEAERVVGYVKSKNFPEVSTISVVDPFIEGIDPSTGRPGLTQTSFDRYGERVTAAAEKANGTNDKNTFHESVAVGIVQKPGSDVIKLDDQLRQTVDEYNRQNQASEYKAVVSAGYANDIKSQISELQKALFEGLIAVLIVGSLVIAVRASLITVLSMLTVLATTVGILYLLGYSLNTITLFALILCLGLIVDDTIIMVEALDAQRRRLLHAREIVRVATRKVSRAMVAATFTAALSFAPLLFVGGVLGDFIRAIPITVIISLLVSLVVALIFIPLFARYLLLGKKQLGPKNIHEPAAAVESRIANFISKPMLWARHSRKRLLVVGSGALLLGLAFIVVGGLIFKEVTFNIFPPTKDTNGLVVQLQFPPGTTINQAEATADRADSIVAGKLGQNFKTASYYANADEQQATLTIHITPYDEREIRSPELSDQLQAEFDQFEGARVEVGQLDVGPPVSSFNVLIVTDNRDAAFRLADDVRSFLQSTELKRPSGEVAKVSDVTVADPGVYTRTDGKAYVAVTANFDATDTSTLVTLAQDAIEKEFTEERLKAYGLPKDAIDYNLGQEQENQDSFKSLALAFPIMLLAVYILLATQFRSLLQPLLIFVAIPFSFLGITLGLYLTDNAFSFFAMLGFFALIGLSLKNTILLTDYANQLRRTGMPPVEAAVGALRERFRPLIATSLTAVVSLTPLALTSPFWEGLAVVLIGGLLSSTFLVITVFPYYYLGAEYLRMRINRKRGLLILSVLVAVVVLAGLGL